jgi:deoxyadenosine/deoxycytidine kinase
MLYPFIAIEGNIGAGKTSLTKLLAKEKSSKLILEQFEDNSFLPKFYNNPEKYSFPLELSFLAERYQQLKTETSQNSLFEQQIFSDYFIYKCLIFAQANLPLDEFKLYQELFIC